MVKKAESRYKFTLQTGFVLALAALISIFYFFPRFSETDSEQRAYHHPIQIISVPPTRQARSRRPPPARPLIPVAEPEPELLSPVPVDSFVNISAGDEESRGKFLPGMPEGFRPKQILEVVPEKVSQIYRGVVVLALKIDSKGRVSAYRLLKNTTGAAECERRAAEAAKASIWEPAVFDGHPATYWIEKTYQFNIE